MDLNKGDRGIAITSHGQLNSIHHLGLGVHLAFVLARVCLPRVVQPEGPRVASRCVLRPEPRVRAERRVSGREDVKVLASHPGHLKAHAVDGGITTDVMQLLGFHRLEQRGGRANISQC